MLLEWHVLGTLSLHKKEIWQYQKGQWKFPLGIKYWAEIYLIKRSELVENGRKEQLHRKWHMKTGKKTMPSPVTGDGMGLRGNRQDISKGEVKEQGM